MQKKLEKCGWKREKIKEQKKREEMSKVRSQKPLSNLTHTNREKVLQSKS